MTKARALLPLVLPALVVGVGCSLVLLVISFAAESLQHLIWPDGSPVWWPLLILTLTGLAVGLLMWKIPTGPDPATESLVGPPLPVRVMPGMLLASILTLAGGVSLGPENPITAATIAFAVALGGRLMPLVGAPVWLALAVAGTVGAMFGTPVAAALILSEMALGSTSEPLWDRLFAPLIAAGAGAATTVLLAAPLLSVQVPDYPGVRLGDLLTGGLVAAVAAVLGMVAVYVFPHAHRLFHRASHPVLRLTLGGLALGVLGVIGGQITLFKGLEEMKELTEHAAAYTAGALSLIVVVKLTALVISACCAFVGGRIFPTVFVGVALGLLAARLLGMPEPLAIGCAVLGLVLAITQQGWLSLFMAVTVVTDLDLLPVLCLALLPAWLIVTGRPQMVISDAHEEPTQLPP
ncbi:ion channel protein [Nonomuraea sp. NPDC046570]|uniref:ion channel protein n=1 Tax=Nonomuraea sp. NPDC046570 TaxID=3155255 RepID=UPI0033D1DF67